MEEFIEKFNEFKDFIQFAKDNPDEPITTNDIINKFESLGLFDAF